jgi:predicted anti-sigma-YlaC factor YlaD
MTGDGECTGIRHMLGVYLLGAIEPAERAAVDSHLARCRECREELAGLAALPALLGKVTAAEAGGLSPDEAEWDAPFGPQPETDLPRLLDRATRIRRVRRGRGMAAAAAAILIAAGAVVGALQMLNPVASPVPGQIAWKTISARNDLTRASVTVDYAPTAWGTTAEVRVSKIAAGTACKLLVTNSRGQEAVAGGWTVAPGDPAAWYPASASFPASSVRSFEITADGKTLVSVPAGPSAAPAAPGSSWPG